MSSLATDLGPVEAPSAWKPRASLEGLLLVAGAPARWEEGAPFSELARNFPGLECRRVTEPPGGAVVIFESAWCAESHDPYFWDELLRAFELRPGWLVLQASPAGKRTGRTALEILTRFQRLLLRRNEFSNDGAFDAALRVHRELHELDKPLVKADYDHALDVWQWTLRLNPRASRALQLAALFHDIERLWSEAERRVEHRANDYQAFKDAHARGGAERAMEALEAAGLPRAERLEVGRLIAEHERPFCPSAASPWQTLADADALSFFALNSPGFADYFGPAHTEMKVRYTLGRMTQGALARLGAVRLRADIASLVSEALPDILARRTEGLQ